MPFRSFCYSATAIYMSATEAAVYNRFGMPVYHLKPDVRVERIAEPA